MPSYDNDYPTEEETILLQQLKQSDEHERNEALNQVQIDLDRSPKKNAMFLLGEEFSHRIETM